MSILWIYDKVIDPMAGGTERTTHSVMSALGQIGHSIAGFLVFHQDQPRAIHDGRDQRINDLYAYLKDNGVHVVINQIGYSRWLLEEFLNRGGQRWKDEGGCIITCLHFDPAMFAETLKDLTRHWNRKTPIQKFRRLGRIALLPISKRKAKRTLCQDYAYLLEQSDHYVILSEKHRRALCEMSQTTVPERICVIPNPNTFTTPYTGQRVKDKDKTVLIVSRLDEPQKRISLALLAWDQVMRMGDFDEWTLRVVGDGEYSEDYRDLVSKRQIRNVTFIGRTDPEEHYEYASIYLHTSKREGWGLTITEAMQKGAVPIVMNSCAVFSEFINNGHNGILAENGNVIGFSLQIVSLMEDAVKREGMALCAIETTRKHDLDLVVAKWSALVNVS